MVFPNGMVSPGAGLVGYLSLSAVFGILTETCGHTVSQFEEGTYQFDVNRDFRRDPANEEPGLTTPAFKSKGISES